MATGYRAIFRLDDDVDAVAVAEEQMRSWLRTKQRGRSQLDAADWEGPGEHILGAKAVLRVAELDHDGDRSRRHALRFSEENSDGVWDVSVVALSLPQARANRQTLFVSAGLVGADQEEAIRRVAPPKIVEQLLERLDIHDGAADLTAAPRIIHVSDVDDVIDAILDRDRTAAVVVAGSPGAGLDERWAQIVGSLTKQSMGNAAVFVIAEDAFTRFGAAVPSSHDVPPGRVRTFLPGVDFDDRADGLRHRVLGPATLARAIGRDRVNGALPAIHASGIRRRLLQSELPADVRRSLDLLAREEAREQRASRVEKTVAITPELVPLEQGGTGEVVNIEAPDVHDPLLKRLRGLVRTWLGRVEVDEDAIDQLDRRLAQSQAESVVAIDQLSDLLDDRERLQSELEQALIRVEDVELEAAIQAQNSTEYERETHVLRARLIAADAAEATYVEPLPVEWTAPEDIQELVSRITLGDDPHPASEYVVFSGDLATALEVQKRDPVGRYASAFWEYIHVLHDYAKLKAESAFTGSVHQYLNALGTHSGHMCSPDRHAARESETVINRWGDERIFPVPVEVSEEYRMMMLAHFKPTNENTFAPRLHYHDDTSNTGKVYVGYIGKHLTNTRTKSA